MIGDHQAQQRSSQGKQNGQRVILSLSVEFDTHAVLL